ncbi:gluconolactonase [Hydrocarboniphaga daqingensis]|uniref:Gluconolactonase n=1 Tax=Hydrocarboniphaga daqingensis TaxID=490188 RepID=A0A1M5KLV0_9GAMM|nr:SMP-30/gluconolactonase/LRE family protein [Hydrocarboniphaga daqingensis]SHG53731.1 gluconolactonase [Hydrocarboniphaga daqingensis]
MRSSAVPALPRYAGRASLLLLLAAAGLPYAQADELRQPTAIAGVVAAGTPIDLIKDGFKGTEGPLAFGDGALLFTENQAGRIIKIDAAGTVTVHSEQTNGANALALAANGDLFAVQTANPRVGIIEPASRARTLAADFQGALFGRPNDLVLDQRGGVYFTDSGANANSPPPVSTLKPAKPAVYYVTSDGRLQRLADDIERPNGVQLSPDEKTLYVANTLGDSLIAFDVAADGSVSRRRNFVRLEGWSQDEKGTWSSGADGLAVDADGRIYVATNAGVEVFSAQAQALGVIRLPKKPQNLAFAGNDKKTLYVVGRGAVYRIATLTSGYRGRAK